MTATPFALVSTEDRDKIVAYGLHIELVSGQDIITYRRDLTGHTMFGVHQSVDAVLQRFNSVTPVELVWEPGCRCCLCITGDEDCGLDGTCSGHLDPRPTT